MEEIKMYTEILRTEAIRTRKDGKEIVSFHSDHAYAIADLLEGLAAKLEHDREWIQRLEKGLHDEKKAASDLREENKILWGALNMATGRVRELWGAAK